jgi:hypothetical protein
MVGLLLGAALSGPLASTAWATRQIFIWYPDGGPLPASAKICHGLPPAFQCRSGAHLDECRRGVQAHLDRWYADFDVTFTYDEPTSGEFDTVVAASSGAWCQADANTSSRSPLPLCGPNDLRSVAIFHCGDDPKLCATLIAKEHAHLWGLQHTGSLLDVMSDQTSLDHAGFEDAENLSDKASCGRFQNSYRLMLQRLGAWTGGTKPEPTPPEPRAEPAAVDGGGPQEDAAEEDTASPPDDATDDATADATADLAPDADAGAATDPGDDGGCGCTIGGRAANARASHLLVALLLAGCAVSARRASGSRSCRRAGRPWPGGARPPRDRG